MDQYKENCLQWIQNFIDKDEFCNDFYQHIHIDKKWFVLVKDGNGYYIALNKPMPPCNIIQHKKHVAKVMFLLAVACPGVAPLTGKLWDGKLGIWVFVKAVESKAIVQELFKREDQVERLTSNKGDHQSAIH